MYCEKTIKKKKTKCRLRVTYNMLYAIYLFTYLRYMQLIYLDTRDKYVDMQLFHFDMQLCYVDMREKFADMQPFYVYIKLNYVDKQLIYISMQFIYVTIRR